MKTLDDQKPKISIAGGLIEIDVKGSKKDKEQCLNRVMGKHLLIFKLNLQSNSKSKNVSIKFRKKSSRY